MLDPETTLPISQPLKTVEEVYNWVPGSDAFCVATVPKKPTRRLYPDKPKTLVCHDMQGGYREDSHNIVTIPPPCWTNAGHKHGVKVLGTFITEWDDGVKHCADILKDETSYQRFAKQLVDISCYYNFDGWLINIENVVAELQVSNLVGFVGFLTKSMHDVKQDSEVIWYDSVTNKGLLDWQNELNSSNSLFFDACDGIFLNYTWTAEKLSKSAIFAGEARKFDVYVGVDCFGRGCFGGGGWNTYLAMQVIREHNLSAAIFAPGWVWETQPKENFTESQNKFWHLLMSYLYPHVATQLPIVTSFCQGYGEALFSYGNELVNSPWTNLNFQQLQPTNFDTFEHCGSEQGFQIKDTVYCTEDAYLGGGCLKINGIINTNFKDSRKIFSLFRCDCVVKNPLFVALTFKLDQEDLIEVFLLLSRNDKSMSMSPLLGPSVTAVKDRQDDSQESMFVETDSHVLLKSRHIHNTDNKLFNSLKESYKVYEALSGESCKIFERQCTGGVSVAKGWHSRYYLISEEDIPNLKEIKILLSPKSEAVPCTSPFSVHLGELMVMDIRKLFPVLPELINIRESETSIDIKNNKKQFNTTLTWNIGKTFDTERSDFNTVSWSYNIYCDNIEITGRSKTDFGVLIGRASLRLYRVVCLELSIQVNELTFVIQPVSESNIVARRDQCGYHTIVL